MSVDDDLLGSGANARKPRQCTSNWRTPKPCPVPGCGQLKTKPREHMRSCHRELTPADIDELMKTLPPAGRRRKTGSKAASTTASLPITEKQHTVSSPSLPTVENEHTLSSQQGTCGTDHLPSSSPSTCSVSVWQCGNSFLYILSVCV